MYRLRQWSVRHSSLMEGVYQRFEQLLFRLAPLFERIGYQRLETPVATIESLLKGALFDCQMCGQCVLANTGMSCPMNCPKSIRNGPCGGVRNNGYCEVKPDMRCVWVDAWHGNQAMQNKARFNIVHVEIDHQQRGSSSWLRVAREQSIASNTGR